MVALNWLERFFNEGLMQFSSKKCNLVITNKNGSFRSHQTCKSSDLCVCWYSLFTDLLISLLYQLTNFRRKVFMQINGTLSRFSRRWAASPIFKENWLKMYGLSAGVCGIYVEDQNDFNLVWFSISFFSWIIRVRRQTKFIVTRFSFWHRMYIWHTVWNSVI